MTTRVLAVDGGQSATRVKHSEVAETVSGAGVSRGGDSIAEVATVVRETLADRALPPIDRVMLGLTTAPVGNSESERLCALIADLTGAGEVWLACDTVTAHRGALAGQPGINLTVGTGIACLALNRKGEHRTFDGYGYLIGDNGGGFWIGSRALNHALRLHDRGVSDAICEAALERYGELSDLPERIHESSTAVDDVAQFTKDVIDLADSDSVAAGIVEAAAGELAATVLDAADWTGEAETLLALGGRVLADENYLSRKLTEALGGIDGLNVQQAISNPLEGAMALGSSTDLGIYENAIYRWKAKDD
ncbi:MAG: ATPase [Cryobacterium sp.]|nr:ATPase [Cryobacterium sp.]MBX3090031.1 ATPase [Cryobacterium sp.]